MKYGFTPTCILELGILEPAHIVELYILTSLFYGFLLIGHSYDVARCLRHFKEGIEQFVAQILSTYCY